MLAFKNGKILTVDRHFAVAEAVAIEGNRIAAVGGSEVVRPFIARGAQVIDLAGRTVVPGLIDGHAHMDREGLKSALPSLAGARSIADVLERIAALATKAAPDEWIVTMPIGDPPEFENVPGCLKENRFPTRWELDKAAPRNPVLIRSIWGYWRTSLPLVSIANSRALALAGIGRNTLPPAPSVQIERDFASGEPNGIFVEWNKMPVVEFTLMAAAPEFTVRERTDALLRSMEIYNSFGTTSVVEGHGAAADVLEAYKGIRLNDRPTVRATLAFSPAWSAVSSADCRALVASWAQWLSGRGIGDDWLRIQGMYAEADSSPERELRAKATPRTGWAGFHYDSSLPRDALKAVLREAARNGIRVTGILPDMLGIFREVAREADFSGQRWTLGHITALSRDEVAAIRDLGLVVTTHTNAYLYKRGAQMLAQVGEARENDIVPLRTLLDSGVPVSLATDNVPVSLWGPVWQTVARRERQQGRRIAPGQALTRAEALRCATMGGAYLAGEEHIKGSIETGKLADLVVLSDDPMGCDEDAIKDIVATIVIVDGNIVYDRAAGGAVRRSG
jgi:predicted amidohydrolase YtcJ